MLESKKTEQKIQRNFWLEPKDDKTLEELSKAIGGNRSTVLRVLIRRYGRKARELGWLNDL